MDKRFLHAFTWDSLRRFHKVNNHLAAAAGDIEDFGVNILDAGQVSEKLKAKFGITLWQLRDVCDFLHEVEKEEAALAKEFEDYLKGAKHGDTSQS